MDTFLSFFHINLEYAHIVFFLLLLLTGLNIPIISEDILLIFGGAIASLYLPEHTLRMYLWLFFGCLLSAWEAYWIGRILGPKLYNNRYFKKFITPERVERLNNYYNKYGVLTFIVGRFMTGGIRNGLFMSSGLSKMPFPLFILRDTIALLISSSVFFGLGYHFGNNIDLFIHYFKIYSDVIIVIVILLFISFLIYKSVKNNR